MQKIIYIVGPTATGKTNLGLFLADTFNGEILSADSRQVYEGMTIGSGKDIPKGSKKIASTVKIGNQKIPYYQTNSTRIWGYDLSRPDQDFSVALYQKCAEKIITNIWRRKKTPIVVGGTGFYINSIENPPASMGIPQNNRIRSLYKDKSIKFLQEKLKSIHPNEFIKLNASDQKNPRRLLRKIEIAQSNNKEVVAKKIIASSLWIGLKPNSQKIEGSIKDRIKARRENGFEKECEELFAKGLLDPKLKSSSAIGYKQWLMYKREEISDYEYIDLWEIAERQYVKRQMTWFNKQASINWFEAGDKNLRESVVQKVANW